MDRRVTTVLYVSSSDGEGEYRWNAREWKAREGSQSLELITGSIGTWPHGFVSFSIGHSPLEAVLLRTSYTTLARDWEKYGVPKCASDWENSKDGYPFYPSYDQLSGYVDRITGRYGNYARSLQLAQLDILKRLIWNNRTPPGDPSVEQDDITILDNIDDINSQMKDINSQMNWPATSGAIMIRELEDRERIRRKESQEEYPSYRACQALWASKAEYHRNRAPSIQDPYIFLRLPRDTASDSLASH